MGSIRSVDWHRSSYRSPSFDDSSIPQRTLHSTFGRLQQFQEGSKKHFDWSDPWMLVSRHILE